MALIESGCMHSQILTVRTLADQGNLCEIRQKLTAMLRCAGQLSCHEAVSCSDQAVSMLRSMLLSGENER